MNQRKQTIRKLALRNLIGEERASRLNDLLDTSKCPLCSCPFLILKGNHYPDGVETGEEHTILQDAFIFRFECLGCECQFVPDDALDFSGYGVI